MTYGGYTCEELQQLATENSFVTLGREVLAALLTHIQELQVELAEERSAIVHIHY
ncbi:MAG TPA: hypothetical protein PLQ71_19280 [Nitrospira sp.]|nr:hypothetical protein [Nitrospira sp.]